jgi:hypothetical protein
VVLGDFWPETNRGSLREPLGLPGRDGWRGGKMAEKPGRWMGLKREMAALDGSEVGAGRKFSPVGTQGMERKSGRESDLREDGWIGIPMRKGAESGMGWRAIGERMVSRMRA